MPEPTRLLVLGGTAEARALCNALAGDPWLNITMSLAGVTSAPSLPEGVSARTGGFGGAGGLSSYLRNAQTDLVIDATHPYAAIMSKTAGAVCAKAGIPLLRLERPAWSSEDGDVWHHVGSIMEAASVLAPSANVLLTTGRKELAPFLARTDCRFVIRTIEPVDVNDFAYVTTIEARPPFSLEDEIALMSAHEIDTLVTKNAGGAGRAKLDAARQSRVRVIMIDRPPELAADAETVDEMLHLIARHLG
ncbi:MAG: cobalt-precorrin-6A reductase [Pseudomonadota bacterium]